MAYTDINTPVVQKITLPSGNEYYIADRQIRNVVDQLAQTIAGGVSFNITYDGSAEPIISQIPAGITVVYNGTSYTGTFAATAAAPGAFYLVKSGTTAGQKDVYDEYVVVDGEWQKIGDTQIDLSNVVTDVDIVKSSSSVIGSNATFTITQPTIALATDTTSGTGKVQVATGLGTPTTSSVLTGVEVTAQPTVSLTANTASATGRITYVQAQGTATTTKLSASASGDNVTALTGLGTPSTQSAVKSVTPTTRKLATTSVTGVQSTTTTASKATAGTAQTTATGAGTASTTNTDWLKGVSVSNGSLVIGAATMNTQSTPQYTFADVTVPIKNTSATTVASGSTTTSGTGADVVTGVSVGDTFDAVTGYASPTTDTVLGTGSSITLASGTTGDVTVATGIGAATTRYLSASASGTTVGGTGTADAITAISPTTTYIKGTASGANTAWNNKDTKTVANYNDLDVNVTKGS